MIRLIFIVGLAALFYTPPVFAQVGPLHYIDSTWDVAGISHLTYADLDKDGDQEIIASMSTSTRGLVYFDNLGSGAFSSSIKIDSLPFVHAVEVGDFNQDGWVDLIAIGGTHHEAWIYLNNSGHFNGYLKLDSAINILMNDLVVDDFDKNGSDDIVIIGQHSIDLYTNNGGASFTKQHILTTSTSTTVLECLDLAKADMDDDGDMDLICAETAGLVVYINDGQAGFTPNYHSVITEVGWVVHPFDIDGDTDIDVMMNNGSGDVKWFRNDGTGNLTFVQILNLPNLKAMKSIDYNNDGSLDLYASYTNHISVFLNDSNQSFTSEIVLINSSQMIMDIIALTDINNDNRIDYIWSGANKALGYFLNTLPTAISNTQQSNPIEIYPNPTQGLIYFNTTKPIRMVQVFNSQGSLINEYNAVSHIDASSWAKGIYYLHIEQEGTYSTQTIVKN